MMSRLPDHQEMQDFARRAGADLTSCYLALPKIQEHGLDLDHPRSEKLARGECNRSARNEWNQGIWIEDAERMAAADGPADAAGVDLRERCRALWDTTFAPGQVVDNTEEVQILELLKLKHALKERDRLVLDLRFEQGLNIGEVAEKLEKTPQAIYAAFARMRGILPAAWRRRNWVNENCSLKKLRSGGIESARVVVEKNRQLGWDLGGEA